MSPSVVEEQVEIPYGYCHCGCGLKTKIIKVTRTDRGQVKGEPYKYYYRHTPNYLKAREAESRGLKWCTTCQQEKTPDDFYNSKKSRKGSRCKQCTDKRTKEWREKNRTTLRHHTKKCNLRRNYGLTVGDYEELKSSQGNVCAICGKAERLVRKDGTPRELHVDHNHDTGKVRGLLCHYCNTGLGSFFEDETLFLKAVEYLKKHNN